MYRRRFQARRLVTGRRAIRSYGVEPLEPRIALAAIQDFEGTGTVYNLYQNANPPAALVVDNGDMGSFLRLGPATTNPPSANSLSFPLTDPGLVDQVIADFDFRITPGQAVGAAGRADGFGFALLRTSVWGTGASNAGGGSEEPNFEGSVGIGFDIYQNDDLGDIGNDFVRVNYSNSVSVHFDGRVIGQFDATPIVDLASGSWIHARVVIRPGNGFGDISVSLRPTDGFAVTLVDRLQVPGLSPYVGRAYFEARSGGETAHHDLDNINIQHTTLPPLSSGVIEFESATVSTNESGSVVALAVTRQGGSAGELTVQYATVDASGRAGQDYASTTGTLVFTAGDNSPKAITVPILDDHEAEPVERFAINLTGVTGGMLSSVATEATVTILDNDGIVQDFDSTDGTPFVVTKFAGDPSPAHFPGGPSEIGRFLRLGALPVTDAAVQNGIAFDSTNPGPPLELIVSDFDFRMTPKSGRADGIGFALLNTAVYGRTGSVPPEMPYFAAEEPSFRGSLGIGFDIFNNSKVDAEHPDSDINEMDIHNIVSLHFDGVLLQQFDATPIVDLANGQWIHVRITVEKSPLKAASLVSVHLTPSRDALPITLVDRFEISGMLPYDGRAWFGARSGGLASLHDLDNISVKYLKPTDSIVSLSSASYSVDERDDHILVTVTRTGNTSAAASVLYATEDASAIAGSDYRSRQGLVQFEPAETSKSFFVRIRDDGEIETDSVFRISLRQLAASTALGGPNVASVRILDDESAKIAGLWSTPINTSVTAIHSHLLPDGRVIYWDRLGDVRIFNPVTMTISTPNVPHINFFCAGEVFLPSGELFVAGGHHHGGSPVDDGVGLDTVAIYDYRTDQWDTSAPPMNAGRWYPTVTILGSGDVLVLSGSTTQVNGEYLKNTLPQIWDVGASRWRNLTAAGAQQEQADAGMAPLGGDLYPRMFLVPDGRVFKAGPDKQTWFLDTTGQGNWMPGPPSNFGFRGYGTAVMYAPGKVMIAGGGQPTSPVPELHATNSVEVINLNEPSPVWRTVAPMNFARRQHNATILPDGKVLVTGGVGGPGFNNEANAVLPAELWDPKMESWTILPSMNVLRGYHSTAHLLPDGRVFVAGGGQGANAMSFENNAELYSPPYLFSGSRPTIVSAPAALTYGQSFFIGTRDGPSIADVTLVRLPSVTHSFDQNSRFISLGRPTLKPHGIEVRVPANPNKIPPGHWMMFAVSDTGAPSTAKIIQIIDPYAMDDSFTTDPGVAITMQIQANDGSQSQDILMPLVSKSPEHGRVMLNADGSQTYLADTGFVGVDSFEYQVRDSSGHASNTATVQIVVASEEWNNRVNALDVNNDGTITPEDAWLIIDELNSIGPRWLAPVSADRGPPPFVDTNADRKVTALDALRVINFVNSNGENGIEIDWTRDQTSASDISTSDRQEAGGSGQSPSSAMDSLVRTSAFSHAFGGHANKPPKALLSLRDGRWLLSSRFDHSALAELITIELSERNAVVPSTKRVRQFWFAK